MLFHLQVSGHDIKAECMSLDELEAFLGTGSKARKNMQSPINRSTKPKGGNAPNASSEGASRGWEEAAKYAAEHGCTKIEARSILAKQRTAKVKSV